MLQCKCTGSCTLSALQRRAVPERITKLKKTKKSVCRWQFAQIFMEGMSIHTERLETVFSPLQETRICLIKKTASTRARQERTYKIQDRPCSVLQS